MDALMLKEFLLGAIALGSMVAGLFFVRFWRVTGDQLFLFFACAFFLDALSRGITVGASAPLDDHPIVYMIRLSSYGLILCGILYKNFKQDAARSQRLR